MDVMDNVKRRFLPSLESMVEELHREFPDVNTRLTTFEGGGLRDDMSRFLNIECLLPGVVSLNEADHVALAIHLDHVDTEPTMTADVTWGHPCGLIEEEMSPEPVRVSEETLADLQAKLPLLFEALKAALKRGHPSKE